MTRVLAEAALADGLEATASEVHGMAQRGGSVVSTVRFGGSNSPLVGRGEADAILALESMESLRVLDLAHPGTVIVYSQTAVPPLGAILGREEYPSHKSVAKRLKAISRRVYSVDSDKIARDLGSSVVANTVLLGVLLGTIQLPVNSETILQRLLAVVPEGTEDINRRALLKGISLGSQFV